MPSPSKTALLHTPASSPPTFPGTCATTRPENPAIIDLTSNTVVGTCFECNISFASELQYLKHLLQHELGRSKKPDDPVYCPWPGCEHKTKQKGNLTGHVNRRHTFETPFKCKFCECAFKSADTRTNHMRNIHPHEYKPPARKAYGTKKSRSGMKMKSVTPEKVQDQLIQDQRKKRQQTAKDGGKRKARATNARGAPARSADDAVIDFNVAVPQVEAAGLNSARMDGAYACPSSSNALGFGFPVGDAQSVHCSWNQSLFGILPESPSSSSASTSSVATPAPTQPLCVSMTLEQSPEQQFEGLLYELLGSCGCQKVETHLLSPSYPFFPGTDGFGASLVAPRGPTPRIPSTRPSSWPQSYVDSRRTMHNAVSAVPRSGFSQQRLGHPALPPSSMIRGWTNEAGPHPVEPFITSPFDFRPLNSASFFVPQFGGC